MAVRAATASDAPAVAAFLDRRGSSVVARHGELVDASEHPALLVEAAARAAAARGCDRLWLVTTNDNVDALRFYQRRGFRLTALHPGAVDRSRSELKPQIAEVADNGIPIRDELDLERRVGPS